MVDEVERITIDSSNTSDDIIDIYDPRLDFFSEKFDPLFALTAPGVKVPVPNAKKYDNLSAYKVAMDRIQNPKEKVVKKQDVASSKPLPAERKWKEHQMPIKSTAVKWRAVNLFTKMDEAKGIYAVFKRCIDEKLRVKVWTRNQKAIRGYCLAYLVAFDKFWNMVLEDVTEYWSRPKKPKVPALNSLDQNVDYRKIKNSCVRPPRAKVFPHESDKKLESCVRHVDQMMIRGEQVVFVNVIEEDTDKTVEKSDKITRQTREKNPTRKDERNASQKCERTTIHRSMEMRSKQSGRSKHDKIVNVDRDGVVEISEDEIVEISDGDTPQKSAEVRRKNQYR